MTPEKLQKQNAFLKRVVGFYITLTALGVIGFVIYFINDIANPGFAVPLGPLSDSAVFANVKKYGGRHAMFITAKHHGAYYDTGSIQDYLKTIFRERIERHIRWQKKNGVNPDAFEWKVGLCWMMSPDPKDNNDIKHDVCFLPILVSKMADANGKFRVYDYFDKDSLAISKLYFHPKQRGYHLDDYTGLTLKDDDANAYDTGELWP